MSRLGTLRMTAGEKMTGNQAGGPSPRLTASENFLPVFSVPVGTVAFTGGKSGSGILK